MRTERFQSLDGWRGACALVVALFHLDAYSHFYEVSFIRNSWLFVDFFFVLSGFVITHAYMTKLGSWTDVRAFVVRRFGRLWPLHVAMLVFLVGLECVKAFLVHSGSGSAIPAFSGERSFGSLVANVFLVHALGIYDHFTWNDPSWSISTEFYTYLVFACVFTLARSASASLVTSIVLALGSSVSLCLFAKNGFGTFQFSFVRTLYGFFVGHLTYRLWNAGVGEKLFRRAWLWETGVVAGVAAYIIFLPLDGLSAYCFAAPIVFAFVIWIFAHEVGPVSRFMGSPPVTLLGERSYSIYMVHAPIVLVLDRSVDVLQHHVSFPLRVEMTFPWANKPESLMFFGHLWMTDVFTVAYLLAVILTAGVTYKFIERPGRAYFNSMKWAQSGKRSPQTETASPASLPSVKGARLQPCPSQANQACQ